MDALTIVKLPDGGFLITERPFPVDMGFSPRISFACTDIGEALDYIEEKLKGAPLEC
jgi:hypothetical protein